MSCRLREVHDAGPIRGRCFAEPAWRRCSSHSSTARLVMAPPSRGVACNSSRVDPLEVALEGDGRPSDVESKATAAWRPSQRERGSRAEWDILRWTHPRQTCTFVAYWCGPLCELMVGDGRDLLLVQHRSRTWESPAATTPLRGEARVDEFSALPLVVSLPQSRVPRCHPWRRPTNGGDGSPSPSRDRPPRRRADLEGRAGLWSFHPREPACSLLRSSLPEWDDPVRPNQN